ncbi:hypothetical protein [Kitasatospora sp. NPDC093102]|uniref:hypothetical protein n=1 Tax=Kitasatospora sp. NPDC093102 TaxID=3155069 RepID=UPI0034312792
MSRWIEVSAHTDWLLRAARAAPAEPARPPTVSAGLVLLPTGLCFDAVRMPQSLGMDVLDRGLRQHPRLVGPVLHDRFSRTVYFLVPSDDEPYPWSRLGLRLVSSGGWLAVPDPVGGPHAGVDWLHLPSRVGRLSGPHWLAGAAIAGLAARLAARSA